MLHGFGERQISDPVVFLVFLVTNLIHDIEGITAFCVDRIVKADRALDGVQCVDDVFFRNLNGFRDLVKCRLLSGLAGQAFSGIDGLVSNIPQGTADTDAVITRR